jgi:hypothetical protein
VKPLFVASALKATFTVAGLMSAAPQHQNKVASANATSNKKDVVHLVVGAGSNLKQIFTYCPFPTLPTEHASKYQRLRISGTGIYRLIADQQGNVTEIKILKRMGALGDSRADVAALKTFIRWRGKAGSDRIVDVTWGLPWSARVITTKNQTGSHIPLH